MPRNVKKKISHSTSENLFFEGVVDPVLVQDIFPPRCRILACRGDACEGYERPDVPKPVDDIFFPQGSENFQEFSG